MSEEKVVKNVAGYDLCKLFIGARHSLGIIVEATFKLRPLPESEVFASLQLNSLSELHESSRALLGSAVEPVILDACDLTGRLTLVAAFAGMREDVEVQLALAANLGFSNVDRIEYHAEFWRDPLAQKVSVLPSNAVQTLETLQPSQYLAHLGNGIIFYRGGQPTKTPQLHTRLMERVKNAYDPRHILPFYTE